MDRIAHEDEPHGPRRLRRRPPSRSGHDLDRLARSAGGSTGDGRRPADRALPGGRRRSCRRIRERRPGSATGDRLSLSLSRARLRFTGTPAEPAAPMLPTFFAAQLPAALYRVRWVTLWRGGRDRRRRRALRGLDRTDTRAVATFGTRRRAPSSSPTQDFVDYYSTTRPAAFTGQVWTNNAFIAAQCVAFGITGVWRARTSLLQNAHERRGLGRRSCTERAARRTSSSTSRRTASSSCTAIFVAGAAGLMIFWSWIAPGARTRAQALAEDGRALVTIADRPRADAAAVSGVIEGFVTRQDWPWPSRSASARSRWPRSCLPVGGRRPGVRAGETRRPRRVRGAAPGQLVAG